MPKKESKELEVIEAEIVPEPESKLMDPLDAQYALPLNQQRKLIQIPQNVTASDELVEATVELARSARIPLWGVLIIPTKNGNRPYINADGIRFRLANDMRGVKKIDVEILHYPMQMGDTATVKATVEMLNGQSYSSFGSVKVDSQWNEGNSLLKAETKAKRRASYDAIANAVGMPQYDEDADKSQNGNYVDATYTIVNQPPKNIASFITWIQKNKISDQVYLKVTGEDIDEMEEKNVSFLHSKLAEYLEKQEAE